MKYKNTTDRILRFRANDEKGTKKAFELKPGDEFSSDRTVSYGGLEQVKEEKKPSKKKEVE